MGEAVDLRRVDVAAVLERVGRGLDVRLDRSGVVRKRRSLGAATDRGTWVRIERRPVSRVDGQGWGTEAAAVLVGVAMPGWLSGLSWREDTAAMWHADECELVPEPPVKSGGRLLVDPGLTDEWWRVFNGSLDSLGSQTTTRVATPDTVTVGRELVAGTIVAAFPEAPRMVVEPWRPAHADLNWSNVTGPSMCRLLDWEDWGLAPRGLDAATLWVDSLTVPALAARVWRERRVDLESDDGRVMALFNLAKVVGYGPDDPRHGPARDAAGSVIAELRARPRARKASR